MTTLKLLFVFFPSLFFFSLHALPQGNPSFPNSIEKGLFLSDENFVALKGEYLGDVTWKTSYKTEGGVASRGRSYRGEIQSGLLIVNILNQFEAYGLAGAMKAHLTHRPFFDGVRRHYETHFNFAWGAGMRFIGFSWDKLTLGFDGKYVAAHLPIKKVSVEGSSSLSDGKWRVERWQGAGALSYKILFFVPYLGIRYTEMKDRIVGIKRVQLPCRSFLLKNRHRLGGSAGFGLFPGDNYAINFEGR